MTTPVLAPGSPNALSDEKSALNRATHINVLGSGDEAVIDPQGAATTNLPSCWRAIAPLALGLTRLFGLEWM